MYRAPEAKTIRRQYKSLVASRKIPELMSLISFERFAAHKTSEAGCVGILYVDGHTRAYEGTKRIVKNPFNPAEDGGLSHRGNLGKRLLWGPAVHGHGRSQRLSGIRVQTTGTLVSGDERRMLVGFVWGGWSPTLFSHLHAVGFDVLTWRKGTTKDSKESLFSKVTHVDEHGRTNSWDLVADTEVEVVLNAKTGESFRMRQGSLFVPLTKGEGTRQIHILTTLDTQKTMGTSEVVYKLAATWRQENYFRFGRQRFAMDAHDSYASFEDDTTRMVPNPAKEKAKLVQKNAKAYRDTEATTVNAAMLAISTQEPGTEGVAITNQMHNDIHAALVAAEAKANAAEDVYRSLETRVALGEARPGQQVLDPEMKRFTHIIRMAAFNAAVALAREVRINTGYRRAEDEAHNLVRRVFMQPGDLDPTTPGYLRITLDPMRSKNERKVVRQLCESLTETRTRYPGTDLIMQYAIKDKL